MPLPGLEHRGVLPALREQLGVRAELDDLAVVDHGDPVGTHRCRETVGDEDRGATLEQRVEAVLDLRLAAQIEVRGGLVEHEHAWAGEERARQREQLPFARRQGRAALVDEGVEALGETIDQLVQADGAAGLVDLLVGGVGTSERHVRPHRAREQERLLRHDAELPAERLERDVAEVVSVDRARCLRVGS